MMKCIVLLLVTVLVYTNARHLHPHGDLQGRSHDVKHMRQNDVEIVEKRQANQEEFANMKTLAEEVPRNVHTSRFVPLNNAAYFMGNVPCAQEGFKRDYMGVCREVWD